MSDGAMRFWVIEFGAAILALIIVAIAVTTVLENENAAEYRRVCIQNGKSVVVTPAPGRTGVVIECK
jgi:hypothetical protein